MSDAWNYNRATIPNLADYKVLLLMDDGSEVETSVMGSPAEPDRYGDTIVRYHLRGVDILRVKAWRPR